MTVCVSMYIIESTAPSIYRHTAEWLNTQRATTPDDATTTCCDDVSVSNINAELIWVCVCAWVLLRARSCVGLFSSTAATRKSHSMCFGIVWMFRVANSAREPPAATRVLLFSCVVRNCVRRMNDSKRSPTNVVRQTIVFWVCSGLVWYEVE